MNGVNPVLSQSADIDAQRGRCLDCGDEWEEYATPVICPECHSLNVRVIPPEVTAP